jgi:2-polyprenyl-3-methyl-5-hydroxy-6-metoxy-1,4-benzoquinol methylase
MKIYLNPSYAQSESVRHEYFEKLVSLFLEKRQLTQAKLLDVGCSQLDFSHTARKIESFGIDIKQSQVYDEAHFRLCNLDNERIPFQDGTFDFVIAGELIEHIKRPFEFIEECVRVLKQGGILILSTPNPHYYLEILKELIGNNAIDDREHLTQFTRIHLINFAKNSGLKLLMFKRYKFWIPFIKLMILSTHTPRFFNYQNIFIFTRKENVRHESA